MAKADTGTACGGHELHRAAWSTAPSPAVPTCKALVSAGMMVAAKQRHSRLSWDSVQEGSWQPRTAGLTGLCAVSMVGEVQRGREAEGGWPATFLETSARLSSGSLGAENSVKEERAHGWPEGSASSKALGRKVLGVYEDLHGLVRVGGRMEGRVTADEARGATRSLTVRT